MSTTTQDREPTPEQLAYGGKDAGVLKRFIKEFFPWSQLKQMGFFTPEMKNDYYAQAERICKWFGYESVFEYGAKEIRCHITKVESERSPDDPFVTVIESIYD